MYPGAREGAIPYLAFGTHRPFPNARLAADALVETCLRIVARDWADVDLQGEERA